MDLFGTLTIEGAPSKMLCTAARSFISYDLVLVMCVHYVILSMCDPAGFQRATPFTFS